MPDHEILTLEEVATYLRVSERTVYDWANKGEIPCGKIGTNWRFKRTEIERWVDQRLGAGRAAIRPDAVPLAKVLTGDRVQMLDCESKEEALNALIDSLATAPEVKNRDELAREVFERESLMSTGIGFGVGVPHVRIHSVSELVMAVGINRKPIDDYASLDDQPVRIICMVAARADQHAQYLKILSAISGLLRQEAVRDALLAAKDSTEAYSILTQGP